MGLTSGEKATVENLARASGPSLRFLILFGPGRCQEKYHFVVYLWVLWSQPKAENTQNPESENAEIQKAANGDYAQNQALLCTFS